ncbi:Hypothetical protein ING2D1G_0417 [Peptoniphilus sp. ING2-D1G]|nr:Hypothetical protein ING2D1G_0417 [Peptoniphilus sp. ING2-D1G]
MNQFDDIAEDLKNIKDNLSKISNIIKENTNEIKFQTQVRFEISKETRKLQKLYEDLGQQVYDLLKKDGLKDYDFSEYVKKIDISIARIESLKTKLERQNNNDDLEDIQKEVEVKEEEILYVDEEDLKE